MAKTGDRFEMPDGSVYEVTSAAADTGGQFVEMIFTLPPGAVSPPPHVPPGRARDRVALKALATLGRLLRLRTDVEPS